MKLLTIGASGALGSTATTFFLDRGDSVKALVRNTIHAEEQKSKGAEVVWANLTEPASLENVCRNVDVVITCAHAMIGKGKNNSAAVDGRGHKLLIDDAVRHGVKLFVYTSLQNAGPNHPVDFFRTKYEVEQYLVRSGLKYSILRLPAFMEWHVHNLLGKSIIEKGSATIFGKGEKKEWFIAVRDVVRAIEHIIQTPALQNQIIELSGPEAVSRNQIASLYGQYLHIEPRVRHLPLAMVKFLSGLIKPLHPGIARIMKTAYVTEKQPSRKAGTDISGFGLQPTTVEEFIKSKTQSVRSVNVQGKNSGVSA